MHKAYLFTASGVIELGQGIILAVGTGFAVSIFRKHIEVLFAGFLIDTAVIFILVAQICEIGVLPAGDFGADTNDDGLTDVGTDIRDTDHIGEQVLEVGVEENVAGAVSHAGQVAFLELQDHVCGNLAQGLDPVGGIDIALFESQFGLVQDLLQE